MSTSASSPGKTEPVVEAMAATIGLHDTKESASDAPSAFSLSMMRQAFEGLVANTDSSLSSSTEQRGELECASGESSPHGQQSKGFIEEKYSYGAVSESESVHFETPQG